jgi:hypothetical protein
MWTNYGCNGIYERTILAQPKSSARGRPGTSLQSISGVSLADLVAMGFRKEYHYTHFEPFIFKYIWIDLPTFWARF